MTYTRNTYRVEVSHPSLPSYNGVFTFGVTTNPNQTRYCVANPFGCSRDYIVSDDVNAIICMLKEHGARLVKAERVGEEVQS